ncbi:TraB/VirB10 family protein [Galenea microaerophila]
MAKTKVKTNSQKKSAIERKWIFLLVGFVFVVIFLSGIFGEKPKPKENNAPIIDLSPEDLDKKTISEKLQSEIDVLRSKTNSLEQSLKEQKQQLSRLEKDQRESSQMTQKNFREINRRLIDLGQKLGSIQKQKVQMPTPPTVKKPISQNPPPPPTLADVKKQHDLNLPSLPPKAIGLDNMREVTQPSNKKAESVKAESEGIYSPKKEETRNIFQPEQTDTEIIEKPNNYAGYLTQGFVPGALLTGVYANTASVSKKNPAPVLMRIQSDAFLAGDARYKLTGCFLTGGAYGDLYDERVKIRLDTLSCIDKKTGHLLEAKVRGFVNDSDGYFGLRGKLINKRGAILAKTLLAGFAQGLAEAGQGASTVTGVSALTGLSVEQTAQSAALNGVSVSAGKLADFWLKEAEQMFPVLQVGAGRKITIVFVKGQQLLWKDYKSTTVKEVKNNG